MNSKMHGGSMPMEPGARSQHAADPCLPLIGLLSMQEYRSSCTSQCGMSRFVVRSSVVPLFRDGIIAVTTLNASKQTCAASIYCGRASSK